MKLFAKPDKHEKMSVKKIIAREGLIFIGLFGISYLVYLIIRFSIWANRSMKKKLPPSPKVTEQLE